MLLKIPVPITSCKNHLRLMPANGTHLSLSRAQCFYMKTLNTFQSAWQQMFKSLLTFCYCLFLNKIKLFKTCLSSFLYQIFHFRSFLCDRFVTFSFIPIYVIIKSHYKKMIGSSKIYIHPRGETAQYDAFFLLTVHRQLCTNSSRHMNMHALQRQAEMLH